MTAKRAPPKQATNIVEEVEQPKAAPKGVILEG